MKKIIATIFIIGFIFNFYGQGLSAINKDRFPKNKEEFSSIVGVYQAELTLDFSSGWNNPTASYRVLKNELGLDIKYNLSNIRFDNDQINWPDKRIYRYYGDVSFKIRNRDFFYIGKAWYMDTIVLYNGSNVSANISNGFGNRIRSNQIKNSYNISFDVNKDIKEFKTDSKVKISLIIVDYLWKDSENENIDNNNRNDNPNDEGRDHRRRRYPL